VIVRDTTPNLLGRLDQKSLVIQAEDPDLVLTLPDGVCQARRKDGTLAFTYRSKATSVEALLATLHDQGLRIKDIKTEEADLEDVFLALTSDRMTAAGN
jgi:ABC-2 type transport system ATP-binding protein